MLQALNAFLATRTRTQLAAGALLLVAAIGAADHFTGFELSLSVFYLIPVAACAWYAGARMGIAACFVCAMTWLLADFSSGHPYSHAALPFWNAGVRLGFFAIVAHLLVRLHGTLVLQESLAQHDSLTGILNARSFRQTYEAHAPLAIRHRRPVTLAYIDLDGFKGINDSLGHRVGDEVLNAVAAELARRLRTSDAVGRLGGDEFALLLPETDLAGARSLFADIRERLLALSAQYRWPLGFSIGVAVFHAPPQTAEEAISCADALMYKVKRAGRNGILCEEYSGASTGTPGLLSP